MPFSRVFDVLRDAASRLGRGRPPRPLEAACDLSTLESPPARLHSIPTLGVVSVLGAIAFCLGLWATAEVDRRTRTAALADARAAGGPAGAGSPVAGGGGLAAAEEEARRLNAAVPLDAEPLPEASAFVLKSSTEDHERAADCLAQAVYYEAAQEPIEGRRAVAQVVLNRVRHPAFPDTVCGVVYQGSQLKTGCQFTFTCDGSLSRSPNPLGWARARQIAEQALAGAVEPSVGTATHYHADYVLPPWASQLAKLVQINRHIFYRWAGAAGREGAFTRRYAGDEPVPLASASVDIGPAPALAGDPPTEPPADIIPLAAAPLVLAEAPVLEAPVVALPSAPRAAAPQPRPVAAPAPPPILARPISPRL